MKVSVIIASFNRPKLLLQAVKSIEAQTYPDVELILVDESDLFSAHELMACYKRPFNLIKQFVKPEERKKINRLGVNMNTGLAMAKGDLVCFLADDDFYFPTWLEKAVTFFKENPEVSVGYGVLYYTKSMEMTFDPPWVERRFPDGPMKDPFGFLDHNQVIHRNFKSQGKKYQWPHDVSKIGGSDAYYFREVAKDHVFHQIQASAAVKRVHKKGLQSNQAEYDCGMSGLRE